MAINATPKILLVDDEEMVLTSIRAFLTLETDYEILTYADAEAALKVAESSLVDVVISDYLMPKMNGIQFLARARQLQPETPRVLLTGHADKQSAIQAINDVSLFQYLEKPWDNQQLLLVINAAIERARLYRDLRDKIAELAAANLNLRDIQARLLRAFF
ncbi:MAG: response regulator [Bryobacterales bacterium]|nr:response regulator [Bryobacterales bacterium]